MAWLDPESIRQLGRQSQIWISGHDRSFLRMGRIRCLSVPCGCYRRSAVGYHERGFHRTILPLPGRLLDGSSFHGQNRQSSRS